MEKHLYRCSKCKDKLDEEKKCHCGGEPEKYFTVTSEIPCDEDLMEAELIGLNVYPQLEDVSRSLRLCKKAYELGRRSTVWVSFAGYDDDPREVWQIPECISWAKEFVDEIKESMAVLGNDIQREGIGLGVTALHALAGYGSWRQKDPLTFEFSVPDIVLANIMSTYQELPGKERKDE